jgi:hypothetical protein
MIPEKKRATPKLAVTAHVEVPDVDRIDAAAHAQGMTRAHFLKVAIHRELERVEAVQPTEATSV